MSRQFGQGETMRSASVIIPFYQRETGLLTRAVKSVLDQKEVQIREIIVVDDGSPVPADQELSPLRERYPDTIKLYKQKNAGSGAARNTGLEKLSRNVEFVSFIDSDDAWFDDFLANAITALEAGYDFFFSDFYFPLYKEKTAFNRAGKINPVEHMKLPVGIGCYEYRGDMFDQILVTGNVIGGSTFAYRFNKFPDLRYREGYFTCEDYLFYLDFSLRSGKFCFSTHPGCDCGMGVSVFSGAAWGSAHLLRRLHSEIKAWRFAQNAYSLSAEQATANLARLNDRRRNFGLNLLHMVRHRPKELEWAVVFDLFRTDPAALLWCAKAMTEAMLSRMSR